MLDNPGRRRNSSSSTLALLFVALLVGGSNSQFTDGGVVELHCGSCSCEGTTDDVDVEVLDLASIGERVAKIDGNYSEILDTDCGTKIVAVGSTLYTLENVDGLITRDMEVVDMVSGECETNDTPSTADCYIGEAEPRSLGDDVTLEYTIDLSILPEGYTTKVTVRVTGADSVTPDVEALCLGDFIVQLFSVTIMGNTYPSLFELAVPGEGSSSELSVASAPSIEAGDFMCEGIGSGPTPAPEQAMTWAPTGSPTAARTWAPIEASVPPTPALVEGFTPAPVVTESPGSTVTPLTLAPTASVTIDVETCDDLATAVAATARQDTTANFIAEFSVSLECGIEAEEGDEEDIRTLTIENNVLTIEAPNLVSYEDLEFYNLRLKVVSSGELLVTRDARFSKTTENIVMEDGGWMVVEEGSKARFLGDLVVTDYEIVSVVDTGDFASDDLDGGCLWNQGYFRVEGYSTFARCDNTGGGESSPGNGGAVFNGETGSILFVGGVSMSDSNLGDNEGGQGAGIYNAGKINIKGDSIFKDLWTDERPGGAIYNAEDAKFTFRSKAAAVFSENVASSGSAVYNAGEIRFSGPVLFYLNGRTVVENDAPGFMKLSSGSSFWIDDPSTYHYAVFNALGAELDFPDDLQIVVLGEPSGECDYIYVETEDGFECYP